MARIKLFLTAMCLITQYFTLNINIFYVVYGCIKWKQGLHDLQHVPIKIVHGKIADYLQSQSN